MTGQAILSTSRLALVPLSDEHIHHEIELDSDPAVMRYLTGRAMSPAEVQRAHHRRMAAAAAGDGLGFWVGFHGAEFIGWWVLQPPHGPDQAQVPGEADLGYRLLARHWRKGYATEGTRELIRYGFEDLDLKRIFAQTLAVNMPSRATMAAAGLTFARAFISGDPPEELVPGAEDGEVEYDITQSDWREQTR